MIETEPKRVGRVGMLNTMSINDKSRRTGRETIPKSLKLLSDKKGSELGSPREKVFNFSQGSGHKVLDVNGEKARMQRRHNRGGGEPRRITIDNRG